MAVAWGVVRAEILRTIGPVAGSAGLAEGAKREDRVRFESRELAVEVVLVPDGSVVTVDTFLFRPSGASPDRGVPVGDLASELAHVPPNTVKHQIRSEYELRRTLASQAAALRSVLPALLKPR